MISVTSLLVPPVLWPSIANGQINLEGTIAGFVDTLIPHDEVSPAASTLGVHTDILSFASNVPDLGEFLSAGAAWLNQTGGLSFADLTEVDRMAIVGWMAQSDTSGAPYRFYELVRLLAVEFYYARPEAIAGFPLNDTPQPKGYLPPWT